MTDNLKLLIEIGLFFLAIGTFIVAILAIMKDSGKRDQKIEYLSATVDEILHKVTNGLSTDVTLVKETTQQIQSRVARMDDMHDDIIRLQTTVDNLQCRKGVECVV